MRWLRIFSSPDGESHFADVDLAMAPAHVLPNVDPWDLSEPVDATSVVFLRRSEKAGVNDWHNPPQRQLVIRLSGDATIETSDGARREVGPGTVLLAEDVSGKGHRTVQARGESFAAIVRLGGPSPTRDP